MASGSVHIARRNRTNLSPFWPFWSAFLLSLWTVGVGSQSIPTLDAILTLNPGEKLAEDATRNVTLTVTNIDTLAFNWTSQLYLEIVNFNPNLVRIEPNRIPIEDWAPNSNWTTDLNATGLFLGYAAVQIRLESGPSPLVLAQSSVHKLAIIRPQKLVDVLFVAVVAILVSVSFINMGCTLDLQSVKDALKKPIGPTIGFCCQYIFMPLSSFGLCKLLLVDSPALQLGLFLTGCSPGGGASNVWTHLLGGNLHLSITMTCISTLAAFAMMPLWTVTLGRFIYNDSSIVVPYENMASIAAGFAVPLFIGMVIRKVWPKAAGVMAQMLKPLSLIIIAIIIGFGTYANLYLFYLMDWRVVTSAVCLVWLGYAFGAILALMCRQPWADALAISIETGIQNTGIAIFVLRLMLEQPDSDINTVVPVSVAMVSPIPLCCLWLLQKCLLHRFGLCRPDEEKAVQTSK